MLPGFCDARKGVAVNFWILHAKAFEKSSDDVGFEDAGDEVGIEAFGLGAVADDEDFFLVGDFDVGPAFAGGEDEGGECDEGGDSEHSERLTESGAEGNDFFQPETFI